MSKLVNLFKQTFQEWSADKAPRLAAALAYYAVFSLAPLLVIIIAIIGLVYGQQQAQQTIVNQAQSLVGSSGANMLRTMINNEQKTGHSLLTTIIGIIILLIAASGFFGQLQDALNTIWGVKLKPVKGLQGVVSILKQRLLSFAVVLGVGFLLLASLIASAVITALGKAAFSVLPGAPWLMQLLNLLISFAIVTVLFALLFKVLPDVEIQWRDVWLGAALTSLLFTIGQFLFGLYLGYTNYSSTYGAAGSLVAVLFWVYISSQILFLGAEFTEVYTKQVGGNLKPAPNAEWMTAEDRANQGMQPKQKAQAAAPTPIYRTEQAGPSTAQTPDRGALRHMAEQPGTRQVVQPQPRPETPASKAMDALGVVSLALVGYLASLFVVSKRH